MKRPESLKRQFLHWLAGPLAILFAVSAWFGYQSAVDTANRSSDRLLTASARVIAEDMQMIDGRLVVDLPRAAMQLLEAAPQEQVLFRVVAPDGSTAAGADDLPLPASFGPAATQPALYADEYRGQRTHLVALNQRVPGANVPAPAIVVVGETGESRRALAHQLLRGVLIQLGSLMLATSVLLWLVLRHVLRSLSRVRDALVDRTSLDLSALSTDGVQLEVRPLIDALNTRTARLVKVLEGRERFIADASHQMRTPLAEMRTQIEYSLRHGDDALMRATLDDMHRSVDALGRLIGQMLVLARSDPDAIDDQRTQGVDLGNMARATALDHVPAARARGMDLRLEHSAGRVFVMGNELLLHEMLVNLIDNAIRHGRAGGRVTVKVYGYPAAVLEIEDDGPGIGADERERVFERFYRGREAQSAGSGLGLSIARNICTAHRAALELLTPATGQGLCVRVRFTPRY